MLRAAALLAIGVFATLVAVATRAQAEPIDLTPHGEAGWQEAANADAVVTRARLYALLTMKPTFATDPESGESYRLDAALRAYTGDESELAIRALALTRLSEHWQLTLGVQEIAWGETFGPPVADLVCPHDLRDPFFLDLDWTRLPVAAASLLFSWDKARLRLVATPFPRANLLPARGSAFDPFPAALRGLPLREGRAFPIDHLGRDAEAGARASYLLPGGLDLTLLYFFHWSRTPAFRLTADATAIEPVIARTHTTGVSFSKTVGDFVLRGDGLAHFGQPIQDPSLARAPRGQELVAVVGTDVTTAGDLTLGAQGHLDVQLAPGASTTLGWVSARAAKSLFGEDLSAEIFVLRGIGNHDTWLEPKVTWKIDRVSLSLRGDLVWGSEREVHTFFAPYPSMQRAMLLAHAGF